jgi:hypothetical protein
MSTDECTPSRWRSADDFEMDSLKGPPPSLRLDSVTTISGDDEAQAPPVPWWRPRDPAVVSERGRVADAAADDIVIPHLTDAAFELAVSIRPRRVVIDLRRARQVRTLRRLSPLALLVVEGGWYEELSWLDGTATDGLALLHATRLQHLDSLPAIPGMQRLMLNGLSSLTSLSGIVSPTLTELHVTMPMSRTTMQWVDSLAPLRELPALRSLHVELCPRDGSLAPLLDLPLLERVDLPNRYPMEEFAALRRRFPHATGTAFEPLWPVPVRCERCGSSKTCLVLGVAGRPRCRRCDADYVNAQLERYHRLVTEA